MLLFLTYQSIEEYLPYQSIQQFFLWIYRAQLTNLTKRGKTAPPLPERRGFPSMKMKGFCL